MSYYTIEDIYNYLASKNLVYTKNHAGDDKCTEYVRYHDFCDPPLLLTNNGREPISVQLNNLKRYCNSDDSIIDKKTLSNLKNCYENRRDYVKGCKKNIDITSLTREFQGFKVLLNNFLNNKNSYYLDPIENYLQKSYYLPSIIAASNDKNKLLDALMFTQSEPFLNFKNNNISKDDEHFFPTLEFQELYYNCKETSIKQEKNNNSYNEILKLLENGEVTKIKTIFSIEDPNFNYDMFDDFYKNDLNKNEDPERIYNLFKIIKFEERDLMELVKNALKKLKLRNKISKKDIINQIKKDDQTIIGFTRNEEKVIHEYLILYKKF